MINISDSELMAEKLGMIVLCENCGKRLKRTYVARIGTWRHEDSDSCWCPMRKIEGKCIIGSGQAHPRKGPMADCYEMEPK